jgi:hypothetical protein
MSSKPNLWFPIRVFKACEWFNRKVKISFLFPFTVSITNGKLYSNTLLIYMCRHIIVIQTWTFSVSLSLMHSRYCIPKVDNRIFIVESSCMWPHGVIIGKIATLKSSLNLNSQLRFVPAPFSSSSCPNVYYVMTTSALFTNHFHFVLKILHIFAVPSLYVLHNYQKSALAFLQELCIKW